MKEQDELYLTDSELCVALGGRVVTTKDLGWKHLRIVREAQLAKAKQHYEQKIKELEGELEREKFHHQFAEDVIEDMREENNV